MGESLHGPGEFTTSGGLRCLTFESVLKTKDRKSMTAYISTGDVIYSCHTAYPPEQEAAAEKIIRDWAESLH